MPFNDEIMTKPVTRLALAPIFLATINALYQVRFALAKMQKGMDVTDEVANLEKVVDDLNKRFDAFTGWTPEDDG